MGMSTAYNSGLLALASGGIVWETDGVYAVLVNGYTFNPGHTTYADVSSAELDDTGDYGPVDVTGKSVSIVAGANEDPDVVRYDSDDVAFGDPVTIGPADGIVFIAGSGASPQPTDALIFFGALANTSSTSAVFSINTPTGVYEIEIN